MIDIQKITDYSYNLELLLEQYKGKDKITGLIDSMNDQADDFETAIFEIKDLFYLSVATGIQLDIIGDIFGERRLGRTDTEYRAAIQAKASLAGSGEPESIINILLSLYGGTFVTYIPAYPAIPAAYYIHTDAVITLQELEIFSPAGVQPYFLDSLKYEDDTPIEFEDGSYIYVPKI